MKRKFLQYLLWVLAKMVLWRYRPLIIAVAGSTGKSSTKEAIYYALKNNFKVSRSFYNLNTEIGLPLTIIKGYDAKRNIFLWLVNIFRALGLFIIKRKDYPQIWVLEMSEDHPHSISYLTKLCQPKIGVISWIDSIPVHSMFYQSAEDVQEEIRQLVALLPSNGTAVLNADNDLSLIAQNKTKAKVITYGFSNNAEVKISQYSLIVNQDFRQMGLTLRLEYQGSYVPLRLIGIIGQAQAYALTAAAAVGLSLGLNLVQIAENLREYKILKSRTNFIPGIKNTWILDDSYNSNPAALRMALNIFQEIASVVKQKNVYNLKRKVVALGEMRELGKYSDKAHQQIAPLIIDKADIFIAIGNKMKITVEECLKLGFPKDKIFWFENSLEAGKKAKELIQAGDLWLVKGSRGVHLEQVTLAIMKEPEKAKEYLSFEEPT